MGGSTTPKELFLRSTRVYRVVYGCIYDKAEMAEQNSLIKFNGNQVRPSLFFLWVRIEG